MNHIYCTRKLLKERNGLRSYTDRWLLFWKETGNGQGSLFCISALFLILLSFSKSNKLLLNTRLVKQDRTGKSFNKAFKRCIVMSALFNNRASCYSEFKCSCAWCSVKASDFCYVTVPPLFTFSYRRKRRTVYVS